jgi:ATP-binding cassette subfamily B (MDR/TAP) protein 6
MIAIVFFVVAFNMWFGIIMFISVGFYLGNKQNIIVVILIDQKKLFFLGFTVLITEWRSKFRRDLIALDNAINARAVDSLINFETVKYFGNESYELEKYRETIQKYQVYIYLRFNIFCI